MNNIIWVTGGYGFIGRNVAREAAQQGFTVLGLGHGHWPANKAKEWGVSHWVDGELSASNLQALYELSGKPNAVIHLAGGSLVGTAIARPREDFFRTVVGSMELFDWVRGHSPETSVVAVSSAAVYGAGHDQMISELAKEEPFSPYGHHKYMMESLCHSYASSFGLKFVVARLFSVYGKGLQKQLLWDMCNRLQETPPSLLLGGSGKELRDWVSVSDVAKTLLALEKQATSEVPIFNVGRGLKISVHEIAQLLVKSWEKELGGSVSINFDGHSRKGDPFSLVADINKLSGIGLSCTTPVNQGIAEYVEWFLHQQ